MRKVLLIISLFLLMFTLGSCSKIKEILSDYIPDLFGDDYATLQEVLPDGNKFEDITENLVLEDGSMLTFHLEEGQYFLSDVLGLTVLDTREGREGNVLGVVEDILPGAAAQIYSVKTPAGAEVLVPAVPAFITEVRPGEFVRMAPIDGMFEDSDTAGKESD